MGLRYAILFVVDLERMLAFYRDGLDLPVLPGTRQDGWVELDAGGTVLGLHAVPEEVASRIEITNPPAAREESPMKLVFEVDDVEASRTHLLGHGAVMHGTRPWGGCDGLDPEGNVFQIVTRR